MILPTDPRPNGEERAEPTHVQRHRRETAGGHPRSEAQTRDGVACQNQMLPTARAEQDHHRMIPRPAPGLRQLQRLRRKRRPSQLRRLVETICAGVTFRNISSNAAPAMLVFTHPMGVGPVRRFAQAPPFVTCRHPRATWTNEPPPQLFSCQRAPVARETASGTGKPGLRRVA